MISVTLINGIFLILCLFVAFEFFIFSSKRDSFGFKLLSINYVSFMIMFLGEAIEVLSTNMFNKLIGLAISEIAYATLPIIGVCFALYLLNEKKYINLKYIAFALIVPFVDIVGNFINCFTPIFYSSSTVFRTGFVNVDYNVFYIIVLIYLFAVGALSIILLVRGMFMRKKNLKPFVLLFLAYLLPMIFAMLFIGSMEYVTGAYVVSMLLSYLAIFGYDILDSSVVHQEFLDSANVGMLYFRLDGRLLEFNNFFKEHSIFDGLDINQLADEVFKKYPELLAFFNGSDDETLQFFDSVNIWFKINKNPVYKNDNLIGYLFIFDDVTIAVNEQKRLDLLIRESNHRMKNNLNLLNRFISLEKRFNKDNPEAIIEDTIGRIDSLSLYHEKLYKTDNLKDINVKEFIQSFIDDLIVLYGDDYNFTMDCGTNNDDFELSGDVIIPISLILNELVINSVKYAYADYKVDNENILICLSKFGDELKLHYSDNGKGLPDGFNSHSNKGLGWTVIEALTKQLNGEYEVFNEDGMHFILTFQVK